MLDELRVKDIALIEDASMGFSPGLTVLTGETGAGKTALLGALKLLIGERGDSTLVRDAASEARIEARMTHDGVEHVITRRLSRDGRSRCTFDDEMVTVGALAARIGPFFDLHGQHEHQALLTVTTQLSYLDRFIGVAASQALTRYQQAYQQRRQTLEQLEQLEETARLSSARLQLAEIALGDINALNPQPGEFEQIEQQLPRLRNGEQLAQVSGGAFEAIRGEGGALDGLSMAMKGLARIAAIDTELERLSTRLESLLIDLEDLSGELRAYRDDVEFDPRALQHALDRLGQLEGLRKRYGPRMEDVFETWHEAADAINLISDIDERRQLAQTAFSESESSLVKAAEQLAQIREDGRRDFVDAITASVQDLAMAGASFELAVTPLRREDWTMTGSYRYELLYQPSANSLSRPLAKIASGGELSRVMLALKSLIREESEATTLVFDEIDAGIGGITAVAVAQRLRQIAQTHQVIAVTHLAQIAAVADTHLMISKDVRDGVAHTTLTTVTGEERTNEIARMLSGSDDDVALEHARQLLSELV